MKLTTFSSLLVCGLMLAIIAAPGCRKRPGEVTNIPGHTMRPEDMPPVGPITPGEPKVAESTNLTEHPLPDPTQRANWPRDREIFKSDTAHFDFDSSVVKSADKPKVAAVADYLKAHPETAVEVEGYCDERGTEEYNRSLGERRALALREDLISLGIDPGRIDTKSYGKDRPVATGHDESAWSQNRRGEFVLETPPAK